MTSIQHLIFPDKVILPLSIFPPVNWFVAAMNSKTAYMDPYEHYIKQSFRNRYAVSAANGPLVLSIPVKGQKGQKVATGDIAIDYKTNWPAIHWRTICSAYNSSPFFEHYQDELKPLFFEKYETLQSYFMASQYVLCQLLDVERFFNTAEAYLPPDTGIFDFRPVFKKAGQLPPWSEVEPYQQVFSDRFGFIKNLSILDLLFNQGSQSGLFLTS